MNPFIFISLRRAAALLVTFAGISISMRGTAHAQIWTFLTPSPDGVLNLSAIASSADGSKLVLSSDPSVQGTLGQIGVSTNFGGDWMLTSAPINYWTCLASSADGSQLVAGSLYDSDGDGGIYISRDSGMTWNPSLPYSPDTGDWVAIASSAAGNNLVAVGSAQPFGIYYSADAGITWHPASGDGTTNDWASVVSSGDGNKLVAVGAHYSDVSDSGVIYLSANAGTTWTLAYSLNGNTFHSVTSSSDGKHLAAMADSGIFTSTNFGATWQLQPGSPHSAFLVGGAVASSADGTRLYTGIDTVSKAIYVSTNSGVSWFTYSNAPSFASLYGTKSLICSTNGLQVYSVPSVISDTVIHLDLTPALTGHVYCSCDSNAIPGATVLLGTNSLTCDANGYYILTNVQTGTYTAIASATNYANLTNQIVYDGSQPNTTNDFYLTNNANIIIYPIFDSSITSLDNAAAISNSIVAACQTYTNYIADPICVRIQFISDPDTNDLGSSGSRGRTLDYSQYLADLQNNTNQSASDIAAMATLHAPPNTGLLNNTSVWLTAALLDTIGEHAMADAAKQSGNGLNGRIFLNFVSMNITRSNPNATLYDLQSTASHEIDEVLGIGGSGSALRLTNSYTGQSGPTNGVQPLDLYRYTAPGFRSFSLSPSNTAYFSITGGTNSIVYFNQFGDGSDFGDWGTTNNPAVSHGNVPALVQDAFGTPGTAPDLGAKELIALDVIGYTLVVKNAILNSTLVGNTFSASFATTPGVTYQIQIKTSLNQTVWQNLGSPFVATDITSTFSDPNATGNQAFYRVIVVPTATSHSSHAVYTHPLIAPTSAPVEIINGQHRLLLRGQ